MARSPEHPDPTEVPVEEEPGPREIPTGRVEEEQRGRTRPLETKEQR